MNSLILENEYFSFLKVYAKNYINSDNILFIKESKILLDKIDHSNEPLELSLIDFEVLIKWIKHNLLNNFLTTNDNEILISIRKHINYLLESQNVDTLSLKDLDLEIQIILNSQTSDNESENYTFSNYEISIIRLWADNVIHGGHWGNGDVIFPDEAITLEKLNNYEKNTDTSFSSRDIDIIKIWSDTSTDTPEEEILKDKIDNYLGIQKNALSVNLNIKHSSKIISTNQEPALLHNGSKINNYNNELNLFNKKLKKDKSGKIQKSSKKIKKQNDSNSNNKLSVKNLLTSLFKNKPENSEKISSEQKAKEILKNVKKQTKGGKIF